MSADDSPVSNDLSTSNAPARIDAITTRWSLIGRAGDGSPETAASARKELVLRYAPAVRSYVRAILRETEEAEELSQDVIVRMLRGDFDGADPARGRFRDLLKTAIRNMIRNHWSRQKRHRQVQLVTSEIDGERDLLSVSDPNDEPDPWIEAWRKSVLDLAWSALAAYEREHPGSLAYTVLKLRTDFPDETSDAIALRLAKQLGKPVRADSIRQQLRRARCRFSELVVREVADGLDAPSSERIEDELIALGLWAPLRDYLPTDWRLAWDG